jgi:predicted dehydrogenase
LCLLGLPDRLQANVASQRVGAQADDWAHVVLDYGDKRAVLHASMLVAAGSLRFIVHGTDCSIVRGKLDPQEQQLLDGMLPGNSHWRQDLDDLRVFDRGGRTYTRPAEAGDQSVFYAEVVKHLNGHRSQVPSTAQVLGVMTVLDAGRRSNVKHQSVELDLTEVERASWKSAGN